MEPPGPHDAHRAGGEELSASPPAGHQALRVGATTAALVILVLASGDAFLLAALLGVAAGNLAAAGVAALAATATLVRWGSSSLAAVAGAQAVLGPAGTLETVPLAVSSWTAAAALVTAAPRAVAARVAFGLAAGVLVAGPAMSGFGSAAVRVAGAAGGVALALAVGRRPPSRARMAVAVVAGAAAVGLAGAG